MIDCAACRKVIHRDELVSATFTQEGKRAYYHQDCEERAEHLLRWKEEAAWAFKPSRLTVTDWQVCSPKKHLGVWQSIFIARRDEDIWCPDCGLKISRHEGLNCPKCNSPAVVIGVESTKTVFTHREPIYKLLVHCTQKGDDSISYAISSGFTPITITTRKKVEPDSDRGDRMLLEYKPREDLKRGLNV
ncbi:MAG TPA: hypothetical protein VFJ63_04015 [Candidatus Bathyarchaeia archaeon]|nr:hypothetical protein [Candidatus Bathyarchaeia archaeon]